MDLDDFFDLDDFLEEDDFEEDDFEEDDFEEDDFEEDEFEEDDYKRKPRVKILGPQDVLPISTYKQADIISRSDVIDQSVFSFYDEVFYEDALGHRKRLK